MKALMRILKKYGHWLFFGFVALITVYMDVYIARNVLDGDASDYLNRGWIIAQNRDLFTRDFYPTTEVRLLDLPAVFALFFQFSNDWTLVRILATVFMQACYVLSFLYLCRQADVGWKSAVYAAGMLLLPCSATYARIVLYHLYYILYMANAFWIAGLTLRLVRIRADEKAKAIVHGILLAALWVFVGLNGVRHMMIIGIPMLVFAFVHLLYTLRRYRWEDGRLTGPECIWRTQVIRLMGILLVSCACFVVGYWINTSELLSYYGVMDMSSGYFIPGWEADHYSQIFDGWLIASGVRHSALKLVGVRGLSLIASLFGFGYLMTVSAMSCFEERPVGQKLMHSMLAISFVTTTLIFMFESAERIFPLYYIPVVAMAGLSIAQELSRLRERAVSACRKLLILLTCACFLFQGAYTLYFIRVEKTHMDQWGGMYYSEMDTVDRVRDCVQFMQENGYSHGLINYWYATTMMEMSDGALAVGGLRDQAPVTDRLELYRWGTSKTPFAPGNLPEKVVVFMEREQCESFEAIFPDAPLVHEGWIFNGYEVDSSFIQ